jgi:hypothetical protein
VTCGDVTSDAGEEGSLQDADQAEEGEGSLLEEREVESSATWKSRGCLSSVCHHVIGKLVEYLLELKTIRQ